MQREKGPMWWFTPQVSTAAGAAAGSLDCNPCLPPAWQEPSYYSHPCCLPESELAGAGAKNQTRALQGGTLGDLTTRLNECLV